MNNKSKWDSLTLKEKSEIMKMAISSGVMDLDNIKSSYNSFAEGGLMPDHPERNIVRVRENDSPTRISSEEIEDDIAKRQINMVKIADKKGHPSDDYFIPYKKEIKIPGVGRTAVSILDSIAVNAKRAGISMEEAYGLAAEETFLGATPNISTKAFVSKFEKANKRKPTKEEIKAYERKVMNSSFSRNYGGIYPQFLINNHEWSQRGWEQSPKYKSVLENIQSPLEHGFTLYNMGLYNTGDPNHKKKVQEKGRKVMSTPAFQEYMKNSKFHNNIKAYGGQIDEPRVVVEERVKEDKLNGIINFGLSQVSKILDSTLIPESTKNRVVEFVMRLSGGTSSMETASNVAKFLTTKEGLVALKNVVFTNDKVDNIVQSALNESQAPYVGNYTGFALPSDILDPDVEGFIDEHPRDSDFVDSYIRGTTPFESAGVIKVDNNDPTRLGRYEQYVNNNYKGRRVNTYQGHRDTIPQELVRELNEKSHRKETRTFGMNDTDLPFPFGEKEKGKVQGYYDAAGYNLELVEGSDGKVYGRISDMYDFLPKDYVRQYNKEGAKGLSDIIKAVDNVGHPFIFRSPWFDPQVFGVPEDLIEHFKNTK